MVKLKVLTQNRFKVNSSRSIAYVSNIATIKAVFNRSKILPPEVWALILEKIEDMDTLISCNNASPMMSKVLATRKTQFLFPHVLHIIRSKGYLSSSDLLNCRLVCKTWSAGVAASLRKPNDWTNYLFSRHHSMTAVPSPHPPQLVTPFSSFQETSDFLAQLDTSQESPFPGSTVQFTPQHFATDEQQLRHYINFVRLLQKFGHHVINFVYHCPGNDTGRRYHLRPTEPPRPGDPQEDANNARIVLWLKLILAFLPNLERLTIHRYIRHPAAVQNQFPALPHLTQTPFPNLPRFQYLEMCDDSLLPFVKQSLLESYGSQLLRIHCRDGNTWQGPFRFNEKNPLQSYFGSLEEVKIEWVVKAENCLRGLSSSQIPNLKRLAIDLHFVVFPGRASLSSVLETMNHFSSLQDLYLPIQVKFLDTVVPSNEHTEKLMKTVLPNLKRFWIGCSFIESPLLRSILRKLPNLQELHFTDYEAPPRYFGRFPPGRVQLAMLKRDKSITFPELASSAKDFYQICPKLRCVQLIRNQPKHEVVYSMSLLLDQEARYSNLYKV